MADSEKTFLSDEIYANKKYIYINISDHNIKDESMSPSHTPKLVIFNCVLCMTLNLCGSEMVVFLHLI